MLELLNIYELLLISIVIPISIMIFSRLRKPLEYRQLSSHVPSATKSLWSEMEFSWKMAMTNPKDLLPLFMELKNKIGLVVHFNIAGQSCVLLNDPDDLKILLTSTKNINKSLDYQMLKPWLNEGLLLSSGSKWQSRRKLLTNTFHLKTLEMYNVSMNKHSRVLLSKLLDASAEGDKEIVTMDYITLCSLDMICDTIMGIEINSQEGKSVEYVKAIKCVCRSITDRVFKFWLWNEVIFRISGSGRNFYKSLKVLHEFTDNVIKVKKESLVNTKNQNEQIETNSKKMQKKSFLDILLNTLEENPDQMTEKDIREEVDTFLFEGHDTTSIAISLALIYLGIYQDIQDRAREEVLEIFGDSDRDVTMEDLSSMKYLEAIVKETLRLYPSVPAVTRELQTALNTKNYSIPPSTTIFIMPYVLHRSEDLYPNPEEFIPERFLDEDSKSRHIFGYLPFSAGPRNCIGQKYAMNQIKTVISTILRKSRFETMGKKEDVKISTEIVIRLDSAPKMKFYKL